MSSLQLLQRNNTRLLAALSIGIFVLVSYFILNHYYASLQKSKMEVLNRLMAIAQTGAMLIDGDMHDWIATQHMKMDDIQTSEQDSSYLQLHNILKRVKTENRLETQLYTIVFYPADSTFHFIVTSSAQPYYRHSYKNYPKVLLHNWHTGGTLDSYKDENGHWLSAVAPIKNSKGEVVALLEADENFEAFIVRARAEFWRNAILSILIVIPFGLLLFKYFATTFKKQELDQELLFHQKEEIETKNKQIRAQSDLIENQNRDLELRVHERTSELQTTNEQLANFLYHSSHDVQAPIATLKGLHQLAELELASEYGKEYISRMKLIILRLEQMVKTIQRVHHIKTLQPQIRLIDIETIAQHAFSQHGHNKAMLLLSIPSPCHVHADEELLGLIFQELFKNAIQFNKHLSNLKISIDVSVSDNVCIVVHNNGEELSPQAKEYLFVMFKRSHENSEGIGLGLYIASVCAQRMKGKLVLAEKPEDGVTFLISLPRESQSRDL